MLLATCYLCKGKRPKDFELQFGHENNFVSKITQLRKLAEVITTSARHKLTLN